MGYNIAFQQAIKLHEQGDLDSAEKIYRQILQTAPNNADVLNLLGLVAQAKGIDAEAVSLFYKAIKEAPTHAPFYFNLAISLENWGKPYEAIESYKNVIKLQPNVVEAYNNIGNIYLSQNEITKARKYFEKALEINPNHTDSKASLAYTFKYEDIDKTISSLVEISNKEANALSFYLLSIIYQKQKELDLALEYAIKAKEMSPLSDTSHSHLAEIYLQKDDISLAKTNLEKALSLNSNNISALINLANIETNLKNYEAAEIKYKRALEITPKDINANINYANFLYTTQRLHEALDTYRSAAIIDPNIPEISNNIGIILKDLGEYKKALDLFFNAFLKKPKLEKISINISETITLLSIDDKEGALKIAQKWVNTASDNVFAKHALASLSGNDEGSTNEYSEKLFDNFADNYEATLKNIKYNLPHKIKELIGDTEGKILDLGCGTGLLGQALKSPANELIGVDLSQNMLDIAKDKNVYDKLIKSEIIEYLEKNNSANWIIAADVFGYIGNLDKIISLCKAKNLCFSIELENGDSYSINETGRYKHSENYITNLLNKYGFSNIKSYPIDLRLENNIPVKGMVFIALQ